jgi:hypothetical protein
MVFIGLLASSAAIADEKANAAPSFKNDIVPTFSAQCVFCHVTGAENAGLNLSRKEAYRNLVSTRSTESDLMRVAPGDPEKSYLMHKLRGTQLSVGGSGASMPRVDSAQLMNAAQLQLIEKWISAGAPNN